MGTRKTNYGLCVIALIAVSTSVFAADMPAPVPPVREIMPYDGEAGALTIETKCTFPGGGKTVSRNDAAYEDCLQQKLENKPRLDERPFHIEQKKKYN